jgi:hypothetical protein
MGNHPSRPVSVAAAVAASLWAFLLLPPQQAAWSGDDIPPWLGVLDRMPFYDGIRLWLQAIGQQDFYLAFGAAASVSFVLVWFATGPVFAELGRLGRVLGALVLITAPITALSYLNHSTDAPLHGLWGAEAFMLIFIGMLALVTAIFARRGSGVPVWERVLLGLTLPILVASTFLFTYWPHGSLVGLGLQAAALAAWGKRAPSPEPSPAGAALRAA